MVFNFTMVTFWMTFFVNKWQEMGSIGWNVLEYVDGCIHFPHCNSDMAMGGSHLNIFSNLLSASHA